MKPAPVGSPAKRNAPVFLFQHGLGADAGQPAALVPRASPFRIATLECPGHGSSPHGRPATGEPTASGAEAHEHPPPGSRPASIAAFADDVAQFAVRETAADGGEDREWVLGGISMGAALALRLVCQMARSADQDGALPRERPSALVLVRPAWTFHNAPESMMPFFPVAEALRTHGSERGERVFERSEAYARIRDVSPDNAASLLGQFRRPQAVADPEATADMLTRIALDGPGVDRDEVGRLEIPTLVIGCPDDVIHPLAFAAELADTIPKARLHQAPSKSYEPVSHAAATRAALGDFIQAHLRD